MATKKEVIAELKKYSQVFHVIKANDGSDRACFTTEAMRDNPDNELFGYYKVMSDFIYNLNKELSLDTSYTWVMDGIGQLEEIISEDDFYNDDDDINEDHYFDMIYERADRYTPISYNELTEWLAEDAGHVYLVDEVVEKMEIKRRELFKDIQVTYCYKLEQVWINLLNEVIENI